MATTGKKLVTTNTATAKLKTTNSATAKLVTVTERVLLYLSTFRSYKDELDAPMDITQVAIAEAVGIARGNVARAIFPLIDKRLVETHKVHVPGIRMKRNAYYLSYIGRNEVRPLKERVLGMEIEVIYPEGKRMAMLVSEAQRFIPFDISMVDIVRESDNGVFDCKAFQKRRDQAERHFLGQLKRSSEPRHFYGRSEELDLIRESLSSPSCNTLVIKGIPGIGKTTLVTKALDAVPSQDMYYFNIQPWSSLRSLILSLAEFLDEHGKRELRSFLDANQTIDLSELEYILSKGLMETSLVLVYDDLQNANAEINNFFSMLSGVIAPLSDVKLVVIGRLVEPFYKVRDVAVDRSVLVLTLEGLSPDHTMALASAVGISQDHMKNIYSQTAGHPFFIELLAHGGTDHRSDIDRFIADEFMSILDKEELEMLKFISVYRYPVQRSAFRSHQPELVRLIEHSILARFSDDFVQLHNMIKEAVYRRLSNEELIAFHSKAAEHYLESSAVASLIEALHHLLFSSQFENAMEIILEKEERLIKSGRLEDLARILTILLAKNMDMDSLERARLLLMQGTALSFIGEWDEAIEHYRLSGKLASGKSAEAIKIKGSLGIAKILLMRNEYTESKLLFETILDWATKHKELELAAEGNYQLGTLYEREADLERAFKHFKSMLRISTRLNNGHLLAKAHYGIGRIYHKKQQFEKALKSRNKGLDIALQIDDEYTAAKILTGIGSSLTELERLEEAMEANGQAIKLARKNGAVRVLAYALSNAGAAYIDKPDLITSSEYLDEASAIFEKLGEKRMAATVKLNMAIVSALRGKRREASKLYRECTCILERLKDKSELMIACYKYGQTLSKVDDSGKAMNLLEKALTLSQEVGDDVASKQILKEIQG